MRFLITKKRCKENVYSIACVAIVDQKMENKKRMENWFIDNNWSEITMYSLNRENSFQLLFLHVTHKGVHVERPYL